MSGTHSAAMNSLILVCLLFSAAVATPQEAAPPVAIISQESTVNHDGSFSSSYESADGTKVQQSGQLKTLAEGEDGESIQGSYSYVAPDGNTYSINYLADENGFVPQGDHIPVAPPIPEAIARSLEYNAAHPEEETQ
ncbi:hypothetical protein L9F63_008428 [Diploptera punctata]|uniref:Uncharacterized protein n=1 Tax=Diploptera punctata TaxID=6984 RepID=A0AAD7Z5S7_DIPPU|nr:hypothetical protein L9F63_008428 [Diploptera punctata]